MSSSLRKTRGSLIGVYVALLSQRVQLQKLGLPIKKGLLSTDLQAQAKPTPFITWRPDADHTTLLVTSEQVGIWIITSNLQDFSATMIVIEVCDLIARKREEMYGACDESLLK